jgi:two-component system, NtrC family, response regulator HydG
MDRILLVLEHELSASTLADILCQQGYGVKYVPTRAEALRVAAEFAPNAIIADVKLGDDSGLELARALRKLQPNVPVLLLASYLERDVDYLQDESGQAFPAMTKPVPPPVLLQYLTRILTMRRAAGTGA